MLADEHEGAWRRWSRSPACDLQGTVGLWVKLTTSEGEDRNDSNIIKDVNDPFLDP